MKILPLDMEQEMNSGYCCFTVPKWCLQGIVWFEPNKQIDTGYKKWMLSLYDIDQKNYDRFQLS